MFGAFIVGVLFIQVLVQLSPHYTGIRWMCDAWHSQQKVINKPLIMFFEYLVHDETFFVLLVCPQW